VSRRRGPVAEPTPAPAGPSVKARIAAFMGKRLAVFHGINPPFALDRPYFPDRRRNKCEPVHSRKNFPGAAPRWGGEKPTRNRVARVRVLSTETDTRWPARGAGLAERELAWRGLMAATGLQ
jgi:hypothetical protein